MSFANQFKTVILLALLTGIFLWIGSFWGRTGLLFAGVFVLIMNFGSYWYSDKIVLRMYNAKEANEKSAPRLYKITHELAQQMKIPMPKVYVIPSQQANAFATGRSPSKAAVAATEGILQLLTDEELKGVMAHEISHVLHRDTLISTVAGTIAGVISFIATMAQWAAIFGGFGRDRDGGNIIQLLALIIVAPITATLVQLAISRSREYLADQGAAKLLHTGEGLANALEKIEESTKQTPMRLGTPATSHLFISNPYRRGMMTSLFSTHPPTHERVKKLRSMRF